MIKGIRNAKGELVCLMQKEKGNYKIVALKEKKGLWVKAESTFLVELGDQVVTEVNEQELAAIPLAHQLVPS